MIRLPWVPHPIIDISKISEELFNYLPMCMNKKKWQQHEKRGFGKIVDLYGENTILFEEQYWKNYKWHFPFISFPSRILIWLGTWQNTSTKEEDTMGEDCITLVLMWGDKRRKYRLGNRPRDRLTNRKLERSTERQIDRQKNMKEDWQADRQREKTDDFKAYIVCHWTF